MADEYIKREDAVALLSCFTEIDPLGNTPRVVAEHLPAADVRPVVRGEWEFEYENLDEQIEYCCSVCDWIGVNANEYKFCPNCGADMREVTPDG